MLEMLADLKIINVIVIVVEKRLIRKSTKILKLVHTFACFDGLKDIS